MIRHPHYLRYDRNFQYDLALVMLPDRYVLPMASRSKMRPEQTYEPPNPPKDDSPLPLHLASLPEDYAYTKRMILQLGLGYKSGNYIEENDPVTIHKATYEVVENKACKAAVPRIDVKTTMCIIGKKGEYTTLGDSGGPYVAKRKNGQTFLIGVNSGGTNYQVTYSTGINREWNFTHGTRISSVRRWMERLVGKSLETKP